MAVYKETIEGIRSKGISPTYINITTQVREIIKRSGIKDGVVEVIVRDFRRRWDLDEGARSFQAHCRHLLLDRETGYRNIATHLSFPFSI